MPAIITHSFVSTKPDWSDPALVRPSNWNDEHIVSLDVSLSEFGALSTNSLLIGSPASSTAVSEIILGTNLSMSGNTLNGPSLTGYVPYTGAAANVNLGAYSLTAQGIISTNEYLKTSNNLNDSVILGNFTRSFSASLNSLWIGRHNAAASAVTGSNNCVVGMGNAINFSGATNWLIFGNNNAGALFNAPDGGVLVGIGLDTFGDIGEVVGVGNLVIVGTEGVALGSSARAGPQSVSVGYGAGNNLTSSATGNVLLGYTAGASLTTEDNKLYISNSLRDLITGDFSAGTVAVNGTLTASNLSGTNTGDQTITLSGDITGSGTAAITTTLATVNASPGSFGSSTAIPSFTVNAKGLITAASTNAVIAPAGTLTGTTLASNVVTSSLTTVGTIATGVWNGTAVALAYGGTNANLTASNGGIFYSTASAGAILSASGAAGHPMLSGGAGAPTWSAAYIVSAAGAGQSICLTTNITSMTATLHNVFIGANTGNNLISGERNIGIGANVLEGLTSGNYNTVVGDLAGNGITTATHSVGIGANTLATNASYAVLVGASANGGDNAVSVGFEAGLNTTGSGNSYFGYNAGYAITTGVSNFFGGDASGSGTSTGASSYNTAVGASTMRNLTSGADGNVCVGYSAGYSITSGTYNVCIGYNAGKSYITTGSNSLYICNSDTATPLIGGTFPNTLLTFATATAVIRGASTITTCKFGIGLTSPAYTLDIRGDYITSNYPEIRLDASATDGGFISRTLDTLYFNGNIDRAGTIPNSGRTTAGMQVYTGVSDSYISFSTTGTNNTAYTERMRITKDGNFGFNATSAFGSGVGVLAIANAGTNPSTNPSGGGVLYSDAGAGKWRGSSGTTTTFGPADPHCPVCKSDFGHEWSNEKYGGNLRICMKCLTDDLRKANDNKLPAYIRWNEAA